MAWSGPDEDLLRELVSEGLSGSQIAARLGKTRSAVCGKAWRFGLCLGGMPAHGGVAVVRVRRKRAAANGKHKPRPKALPSNQKPKYGIHGWELRRGLIAPTDNFVPLRDDPAPFHQRQTVETLEEHHCRWPIGDALQPGFHFCGAASVPGRPYCETHCERAYRTPKVVKSNAGPHTFITEWEVTRSLEMLQNGDAPINTREKEQPVPAFEIEDA